MARHRGRPPRLLVRLFLSEGTEPAVGAAVLSDGAEVGHVTSTAPAEGGPAAALAYVKYAFAEDGRQFDVEGAGRATASLPGVEAD